MDAVIVRIIDMPYEVKGATAKDAEGDYNVYLNARYSSDIRAEAWQHELEHIKRDHFYSQKSVKEMEAEVDARKR